MDALKQIAEEIRNCNKCPLREGAIQPVPGIGEVGAKWLLIGESPGRNEDEKGVPFVGAAGKRLNKLLTLAGIDLNDCYLANVCRCRPPGNRNPQKKEIRACIDFLWREISEVSPEYLISLGSVPLSLFSTNGVTQMHGTQTRVEVYGQEYPLIIQYHPAVALRQPRLWSVMRNDWANLPEVIPHDFVIVDWKQFEEWLNGRQK